MHILSRCALLLAAVLITVSPGCTAASQANPLAPSLTSDSLAQTTLGPILASDLEREMAHLPQDERTYRKRFSVNSTRTTIDLLRRIALRKVARVMLHGSPEAAELERSSKRQSFLQAWKRNCFGLPRTVVTLEEFAENMDAMQRPRRIRLSHIFLRAETPEQLAHATETLVGLRSEIVSFQDFGQRAKALSQSQTARKMGRLGTLHEPWLVPGMRILLAQPQGSMSEPIPLRGGVHLFWVEQIHAASTVPAIKRAEKPHRDAVATAQKECRQQRLSEIEPVPSVPGTNWAHLKTGSWTLSRKAFTGAHATTSPDDLKAVQRILEDEALLQWAEQLNAISARQLEGLAITAGNALLNHAVARQVEVRLAVPTDQEIKAHLREKTYRSMRHLAVRYIATPVPKGADPIAFLDSLEAFSENLEEGGATWNDAAHLLADGYQVEDLPLSEVRTVASVLSPAVFSALAPRTVGDVTPAIQQGELFYVVQILEDQPIADLTEAAAKERGRRFVISQQTRRLRAEVTKEMLVNARFQITPVGQQYLDNLTDLSSSQAPVNQTPPKKP